MNNYYKHLCSIGFVVLALYTNVLLAHNSIKAASPAADAELKQAPAAIQLTFNDATYLESVELFRGDMEIDIAFEADNTHASSFSVTLPELAPGTYTVNWMVVGDDTHEIKGSFSFSVSNKR